MSNLPCEILDHIVDLLHGSQISLRNCCLVSKSWVPRTRIHLFARIRFQTPENLRSWKKTFRDPSTSPACYTKSLLIGPGVLADAYGYANDWRWDFSRLVRLELVGQVPFGRGYGCTLLHAFFPIIKSLDVDFSPSNVYAPSDLFNFILSFPLLEDLSLTYSRLKSDDSGGDPGWLLTVGRPSGRRTPFTGSLRLLLWRGTGSCIRWMLSLPGGIHFRKLTLEWYREEDSSLTMALMEKCSHTLESLDILDDNPYADPKLTPFNLSKAINLRDAVFRPGLQRVEWITLALRTVTREHRDLRRISVDVSYWDTNLIVSGDFKKTFREGVFEQWLDLDRTLVHLWESLSIHANVRWARNVRQRGVAADYVECLFPEMMKRGMVTINLVE